MPEVFQFVDPGLPEEFLRSHKFGVRITPPSGLDGEFLQAGELFATAQIPQNTIPPAEKLLISGFPYYLPNFPDRNPITLEFQETDQGEVLRFLHKWRRLIQDERGTFGYPADYQGKIKLFTLNGPNEITTTATLAGAWPSGGNPVQLDYRRSEAVIISQEFSYQNLLIQEGYSAA